MVTPSFKFYYLYVNIKLIIKLMKGKNDIKRWHNVTLFMKEPFICGKSFNPNNDTDSTLGLTLYYSGMEQCTPNHFWMGIRNHYLIHFVLSGCGRCIFENKEYDMSKGQAFLIRPGENTHYISDENDPWKYGWIAFTGMQSTSLLDNTAFYKDNKVTNFTNVEDVEEIITTLNSLDISKHNRHLLEISYVLRLLSYVDPKPDKNRSSKNISQQHLNIATEFIDRNFSRRITVDDIASHVGINRKYLSSIFTKYTNTSTQRYLLNKRMEQATILLSSTTLSVKEVAYSVGYTDSLLFSKMFKKKYGISPRGFRERTI